MIVRSQLRYPSGIMHAAPWHTACHVANGVYTRGDVLYGHTMPRWQSCTCIRQNMQRAPPCTINGYCDKYIITPRTHAQHIQILECDQPELLYMGAHTWHARLVEPQTTIIAIASTQYSTVHNGHRCVGNTGVSHEPSSISSNHYMLQSSGEAELLPCTLLGELLAPCPISQAFHCR